MKILILALGLLSALLSGLAWPGGGAAVARPVSYPGGWTAIQETDPVMNRLLVHYSPTARQSIGALVERNRDDGWWFTGVQTTRLLQRWNTRETQANLYMSGALGLAHPDEDRHPGTGSGLGGFAAIAADWESRRLFTSYAGRMTVAGGVPDRFMQSARLGFAPYVAPYGSLHTWLMVQIDHRPGNEDEIAVTPLIRLFKSVFLFEAGISDSGEALVNWTYRF